MNHFDDSRQNEMMDPNTARAAKALETRSTLIDAARRLFADKGYFATGTHEIVAAAKVTRGALYHHFPQKEDIFLAVFHAVQHDFLARSDMALGKANHDKWSALREGFERFLRAATAAEVQRIILLDGPAVLGWSEWRKLEQHYGLGIIKDALIDGMEKGKIRKQPVEPLAHLVLSLIDEAALFVANAQNPESAISEAEMSLDTLLDNLI